MLDNVCFVDTETTGLDPELHEIWEVALITPDDYRHVWQLPVDLGRADPMALKINGYRSRRAVEEGLTDHWTFASAFARLTDGLHLAGAVISFDEERLRKLLRANGQCPMWHYHLIDVEALAAGWLAGRRVAWNAADLRTKTAACRFGMMNTEDGPSNYCLEHPWTNHELNESPTGAKPPWKSEALSRAVGVDPRDFDRHTALGDALWARAIYSAVIA